MVTRRHHDDTEFETTTQPQHPSPPSPPTPDTTPYIDILNQPFKGAAHMDLVAASAASPFPLPTNFCAAWPTIKPILQSVTGAVSWLPTWGPTVAAVLTGLMGVAQAIYDNNCQAP